MWSSRHDSALTSAKLCDWAGLSLAAAGPAASTAPSRGAGRGLAAVRPAYDGPTVLGLGVADGPQRSERPPSISNVASAVLIPATPSILTSSTATPPSCLGQSPASSSDEAHTAAGARAVSMASVPRVPSCEVRAVGRWGGEAVGARPGSAAGPATVGNAGVSGGGPAIEQNVVCSGDQVLPRWFDSLPERGLSKVEFWLQDTTDSKSERLAGIPSTPSACPRTGRQFAQPVQAWLNAGHAELEGAHAMLRGEGAIRRA